MLIRKVFAEFWFNENKQRCSLDSEVWNFLHIIVVLQPAFNKSWKYLYAVDCANLKNSLIIHEQNTKEITIPCRWFYELTTRWVFFLSHLQHWSRSPCFIRYKTLGCRLVFYCISDKALDLLVYLIILHTSHTSVEVWTGVRGR